MVQAVSEPPEVEPPEVAEPQASLPERDGLAGPVE